MRSGSILMIVEEEEVVVVIVGVVDSIDGPHKAWECVIYWFLVKFTDKKNGYVPIDKHTL